MKGFLSIILAVSTLFIASTAQAIFVNNPPTADAGGPYFLEFGSDLILDGSGSYDIDAPDGDFITLYSWDFEGDGVFDYSGIEPTTIVDWISFSLMDVGESRALALRVEDNYGGVDIDSTTVTITEGIVPIPEPSTFLLFGSGLIGLAWYGRNRRKA